MATTKNVPSPKSNKSPVIKTILAILAVQAVAAGLFYAGYQYREGQVKHDAQIIKAATATPAPAPAVEAPKN